MTKIGDRASHEQFKPSEVLQYVQMAQPAGFTHALSSDHFHPWSDRQGQSDLSPSNTPKRSTNLLAICYKRILSCSSLGSLASSLTLSLLTLLVILFLQSKPTGFTLSMIYVKWITLHVITLEFA